MSEPRTQAGQDLLANHAGGLAAGWDVETFSDAICAIEAETGGAQGPLRRAIAEGDAALSEAHDFRELIEPAHRADFDRVIWRGHDALRRYLFRAIAREHEEVQDALRSAAQAVVDAAVETPDAFGQMSVAVIPVLNAIPALRAALASTEEPRERLDARYADGWRDATLVIAKASIPHGMNGQQARKYLLGLLDRARAALASTEEPRDE